MCGRFVQHFDPELYASRYHLDDLCEARPSYNVAPTQPVLAIREDGAHKRQLIPLRWGLVPAWSKGPDNRYNMINARAETVHSKPAYRNAFKHRRCLIPAEGFYEWHSGPHGKTPMLIRRQDSQPFTMAGLWERWQGRTGEIIESCTIIVTEANPLVRPIHDRMPVILDAAEHTSWLDPNNSDTAALRNLLQPTAVEQWTLHPVSRQVNNPRNDGPELIAPVVTPVAIPVAADTHRNGFDQR
jgi:putative SOS response-associated peptidase YedK